MSRHSLLRGILLGSLALFVFAGFAGAQTHNVLGEFGTTSS